MAEGKLCDRFSSSKKVREKEEVRKEEEEWGGKEEELKKKNFMNFNEQMVHNVQDIMIVSFTHAICTRIFYPSVIRYFRQLEI